jgi:ankyrin repeat protein
LCVAAGSGFRGLVERLIIKHPHQVNHSDGTFGTPLHASVLGGGHVKIAQLLFEHGANINSKKSDYETSLHIASRLGHVEIEKWLLDRGADVNRRMRDGKTALYLAVQNDRVEAARLILERHAKVNSQENDGSTPLLTALHPKKSDVAHYAAKDVNLDLVWLLLEYGADVQMCDESGNTPLHLAVRHGHFEPELARELLELNAEVDSRDGNRSSPLLLASGLGDTGILQLLLSQGADVHLRDRDGSTTLHHAAFHDQLEVARILLQHGVDSEINSRNIKGSTPLHLVAEGSWENYGNLNATKDLVQLLLDHGADVQARNFSGQTAFEVFKLTSEGAWISNFDSEETLRLLSQYTAK